ncbi:glycosyltransferase family 4 protein [Stappia indica]|uniref:glycosyltransferase family 4 protein n=1 Tax=Stappia indica TaxID=538381 RepID=UPI001CD5167E|nr:glycosyltransferase family 4 protein [Stappia indica]MCA1299128.1 glycosyltransferase family 4 protein [Stappia indica]
MTPELSPAWPLPVTPTPEPSVFKTDVLVHVVRQYRPSVGGLEDFVSSLVARQRGRFARIKVVTLDRVFRSSDKALPAHEVLDGVEVIRLPFHGSTRYPLTPGILGAIADADLVHVHAIDFFFDALALTRVWHRKPMLATTHGGFFHSADFSALKKVWFQSLTRFSANRYGAIACCSQSDYDTFQTIAPKKVRLVENGVDIDKFAGASAPAPTKGLVTIGRLSKNKRVDRLLDAMQALTARDGAWTLDIIGTPFDWSAADITEMIDTRGLSGSVRLHVGPSDEEMRAIIARASLFASASTYEGFGLALIEAMSAGLLPVVEGNAAFRAFAAKHELVSLADFTDPAGAAAQIEATIDRLCAAPAAVRAQAMETAGGYSWASTAQRYEALYREVTGR